MRTTVLGVVLMLVGGATVAQGLPTPQLLRVDSGRADQGFAVAGDTAGNAWVAGSVEDSGRPTRFAVIRYDARGNFVWRAHAPATFGGPVGEARAVAVDASGNAYATGRVFVTNGFQPRIEGLLVKLSPAGAVVWTRALGGVAGVDVAVGATGEIYVVGGGGSTFRFDAAGNLLWTRLFQGEAGGDIFSPIELELDATGNVVVAGSGITAASQAERFASDVIAIKYDAAGNRLWQQVFSLTPVSDEHAWALAVAADGSVLINGTFSEDTFGELPVTPLLLRFDADGTPFPVLIAPELGGNDIAVDAAGAITVGGSGRVTRLDASGAVVWSTVVPNGGDAQRVVSGADGKAYSSGSLATTLLGADGSVLVHRAFSDGSRNRATTAALHRDALGTVFAVGTSSAAVSFSADLIALRFAAGAPPPPTLPTAPGNLTARANAGSVELTWVDQSDNEAGFRIERCRGGNCANFASIGEAGAGSTAFVDSNGRPNTVFRYRVRAFNAAGVSPPSQAVSVRTP